MTMQRVGALGVLACALLSACGGSSSGDNAAQPGGDPPGVVRHDGPVGEEVPRRLQPLDQHIARAVVGQRPGVRHRQNGDPHRDEFAFRHLAS